MQNNTTAGLDKQHETGEEQTAVDDHREDYKVNLAGLMVLENILGEMETALSVPGSIEAQNLEKWKNECKMGERNFYSRGKIRKHSLDHITSEVDISEEIKINTRVDNNIKANYLKIDGSKEFTTALAGIAEEMLAEQVTNHETEEEQLAGLDKQQLLHIHPETDNTEA